MRNRFLSGVFALIIAGGLCIGASAAFADVTGEELVPIVECLSYTGVIDGFPDGSFRPDGLLTRGQFCKIMVRAMPAKDTSYRYANYTIFPDVAHTHWAAPYINFAVSDQKLITGYPDGTFGPDENITEAQAVTIAIRALGYSVEDVGPFWPRDYIKKAEEIGLLEELTIEDNSPVTRGKAARLIYNLLLCDTKGGESFITANISAVTGTDSDGVVVATAETDPSLNGNEVKVGSGSVNLSVGKPFPASFVGMGGTIIYDRNQKAATANRIVGFVPDGTRQDVVVASEIKATEIITSDKKTVKIPSGTDVVIGGELKTYAEAWVDISALSDLTIRYDRNGAIRMIYCGTARQSGVYVLEAGFDGSYNPLGRYFPNAPAGGKIYKNGVEATINDLRRYDVVTYSASSGAYYVYDYRVTGIFQDAAPSTSAPDTVKVLGQTFRVIPGAKESFRNLKIGDSVTLLLTSGNEVAGAVSADTVRAKQYAVFEVSGTNSYLSMVFNPLKIPFSPTDSQKELIGQLVNVAQSPSGGIQISRVENQTPGGDYYVGDYKLGQKTVSKGVKIFEKVVGNAPAVRVDLADISVTHIPVGKIMTALDNEMGQVGVILLGDVLGDSYIYGRIDVVAEDTEAGMVTITVVNKDVTVTGQAPRVIVTSAQTFGGTVFGTDGYLLSFKPLTKLATVRRDQFYFDESVKIGENYIPLAKNVQVYLETSQEFVTLERAKALCSQFEVYSENSLSNTPKVRLIIAKP